MTRVEINLKDELRRALVVYLRSSGSRVLRAAALARLRAVLDALG